MSAMIEFELVVTPNGSYWEKNGSIISRVFKEETEAWAWFDIFEKNYNPQNKVLRQDEEYTVGAIYLND